MTPAQKVAVIFMKIDRDNPDSILDALIEAYNLGQQNMIEKSIPVINQIIDDNAEKLKKALELDETGRFIR